MEPEEDFETWLVILNTVMDDMTSFGSVLPSLKRCLLTIKETENLPPPLEENTARFEKMLYPEVVSKLLALGNLDNDDLKILYDAFEAVIEYCVYGIKAKKSNAVTCISHIILDKESKVYKSNNKEEIRQNMAQMFIVKDGFDASIDALKGTNYDDKSMSLLREIVMNCSEYVHGFDKVSFMKEMCKSMTECAVRNIRILSSNEVMSFFKMFIESDATGITDWLNLFTILLQSNVFDKQLLALKSILSILRKEKNQEEILGWMTDNLDTISSVELHSEFMESIGEIYSYCTNKGLLSMEAITNLWNQQKYIFATELEKFYKIFSQIAQKIPVDLCPWYLELMQSPIEKNAIWFNAFCDVIVYLIRRDECYSSLTNVIQMIWDMAFTENPMQIISQKSLSLLIELRPTGYSDKIIEIIKNNGPTPYTIALLTRSLTAKDISDPNYLFNLILDIVEKQEFKKPGFIIIGMLIDIKPELLSNVDIEKLFTCDGSHDLLMKLIKKSEYEQRFRDYFNKATVINSELFKIVEEFIKDRTNSNTISSLPFPNEDILWHFVSIDSEKHSNFCSLLCDIYLKNDGIILSDTAMVQTFVNQWEKKITEASFKSPFLKLLRKFIERTEEYVDFELQKIERHHPSDDYGMMDMVEIEIGGDIITNEPLKFVLPPDTKGIILANRIAQKLKIPINSFSLLHHGQVCLNKKLLSRVEARYENKFRFISESIPLEKRQYVKAPLSCLPSQVIANSPIMSLLLDLLNENVPEAKTILDKLPTANKIITQITMITKMNSFKFETLFPVDKEFAFLYALEAVIKIGKETINESLERTKFYDYVIDKIPVLRMPTLIAELINLLQHFVSDEGLKSRSDTLFALLSHMVIAYAKLKVELSKASADLLEKVITVCDGQIKIPQFAEENLATILYTQETSNKESEKKKNENEKANEPSSLGLDDLPSFSMENNEKANEKDNDPEKYFECLMEELGSFELEGEMFRRRRLRERMMAERMRHSEFMHYSHFHHGFGDEMFPGRNHFMRKPRIYQDFETSTTPIQSIDEYFGKMYSNDILLNNLIQTMMQTQSAILRSNISDALSKMVIPFSYISPHISQINKDNCSTFAKVPIGKMEYIEPEMIKFIDDSLKPEVHYLKILLAIIGKAISLETFPLDLKTKVYDFITKNFFTLDRQEFEKEIITNAYSILATAPVEYLKSCFDKVPFPCFNKVGIDGDEIKISKETTGLVNLGMTCFLNSTLQQFFAVPAIRKKVIEYDGGDPFFIQLRKLFSNMRDNYLAYTSPKDLANEWYNWGIEKLDVSVQQDASEFVQMFIDKLQMIGGSEYFMGLTEITINGMEEEYHHSRIEPFSTLGVSIKASNLRESLDQLHLPDYLIDKNQYYAETLGHKINAIQVEKIKKLPVHLIIQLKRFEYDYKAQERKKINSSIDIPEHYDFARHCIDSSTPQPYSLNGVIIHSGSALGGHYYSYVKDRNDNNWYEYNDRSVSMTTFDDVIKNSNGSYSNGYLLFYDKDGIIEIDDSQPPIEEKEEIEHSNQMINVEKVICDSPMCSFIEKISQKKELAQYAIDYYLNVLPSINMTSKAIKKNIKSHLVADIELRKYLVEKAASANFEIALIKCEREETKKRIKKLICLCLDSCDITNLFTHAMSFIKNIKEISKTRRYFQLIKKCILINKQIAADYDFVNIAQIILKNITTKFAEKSKEDDMMKYLKSLNISPLIKILTLTGEGQEFEEFFFNKSFLHIALIMNSNSKVFLPEYVKHGRQDIFTGVYEEEIKMGVIGIDRLCGSLFIVFNHEAITIFQKSKIKNTYDKFYNETDKAACYALLCCNKINVETLINYIDEWFIPYVFSYINSSREMIIRCLPLLIKHKSFSTMSLAPLKDKHQVDEIKDWVEEVTPEIAEISTKFGNCLLNHIDKAISIIESEPLDKYVSALEYKASQYLQSLEYLFKIVPLDQTKIREFASHVINHFQPYDKNIYHTLKILSLIATPEDDEFFFKCIVPPLNESNIPRANEVFDVLLPILEQRELPEELIRIFLDEFGLNRNGNMKVLRKNVGYFVDHISKKYPDICIKYIDEKHNLISNNLSSALVILRNVGVKRDIFNFIYNSDMEFECMELNELISTIIKVNSGKIENPSYIVGLICNKEINQETRNLLWELLDQTDISLAQFKCSYDIENTDYPQLTKFLLQFNDPEANQLLLNAAMMNKESFALSLEFLKEHALADIQNPEFVKKIMSQKITSDDIELKIQFFRFALPNISTKESSYILNGIIEFIRFNCEYILTIMEDPIPDAIADEEFEQLKKALYVVSELKPEIDFVDSVLKLSQFPQISLEVEAFRTKFIV